MHMKADSRFCTNVLRMGFFFLLDIVAAQESSFDLISSVASGINTFISHLRGVWRGYFVRRIKQRDIANAL